MRVRLNFATKFFLMHRCFLVASAAVAAIAGIVFLALGWHVYASYRVAVANEGRLRQLRTERANLENRRQKLDAFFKQPENAKLSERVEYLNSIIDESGFLWTQMFTDLEHVKPSGVRVLSISPKMVKGRMELKLKVGATSDDAKLKFIRALETSKVFSRVMLLSDLAGTQQGGDPDVFELSLIYARA